MYGYSGIFDGIFYVIWGLLIAAIIGIGSCSYNVISSVDDDDVIPEIGNSIENLKSLKRDCEKDLPRSKECVLVYEYVPVNKDNKK